MKPWLRKALAELWGLFVDDASFAIALAVWVFIAVFVFPLCLPREWEGIVLFTGVAVILIENAVRTARCSRK